MRKDYRAARSGAGITPSCCIKLILSQSVHASRNFPPTIRWIVIPETAVCLPVGMRKRLHRFG